MCGYEASSAMQNRMLGRCSAGDGAAIPQTIAASDTVVTIREVQRDMRGPRK